jgi:hypothetical protein
MARKMNHLIATLMIGATLQGIPSQAATKGETMGVFTDLRDEMTAPMNCGGSGPRRSYGVVNSKNEPGTIPRRNRGDHGGSALEDAAA